MGSFIFFSLFFIIFPSSLLFFLFINFKMPKVTGPKLKQLMDKRLTILLNANRTVNGTLRGFDQFMNLVLEDSVEILSDKSEKEIGMIVIRGNSVQYMEPIERISY